MSMLEDIKKRLEAATDGPWHQSDYDDCSIHREDRLGICDLRHKDGTKRRNADRNSRFIANAPTDIAFLLAEVERLTKENSDLEYTVDDLKQIISEECI